MSKLNGHGFTQNCRWCIPYYRKKSLLNIFYCNLTQKSKTKTNMQCEKSLSMQLMGLVLYNEKCRVTLGPQTLPRNIAMGLQHVLL